MSDRETHDVGEMDEPERGPGEQRVEDPAGRPEPYVSGPTGPAPVASELRGDPGAEGDRRGEGGALAGAITGTALAGPVGGVVGAVAGGTLGTVGDEGAEVTDADNEDPAHHQAGEAYTTHTDKG